MKFGHLLQGFADAGEPESVCLSYKKLKKLIKAQVQHKGPNAGGAAGNGAASSDEDEFAPQPSLAAPHSPPQQPQQGNGAAAAAGQQGVAAAAAAGGEHADAGGIAEEDREFIATLNEDLSRINAYFIEKEEDAVIRLRALEDRLAAAAGEGGARGAALSPGEAEALRNQMVDFHGELVLLLHWSLVNYAAVAKILKKHDKMTGSRLRAPLLASLLHQPFLSTESISSLVKGAEQHVQELTQLCGGSKGGRASGAAAAAAGTAGDGGDGAEAALLAGGAGSSAHIAIYKRTRAALHMLNDMQTTAATPSTLLPPSTAAATSDAASDAAPGGKKARMAGGEELTLPAASPTPQLAVEAR